MEKTIPETTSPISSDIITRISVRNNLSESQKSSLENFSQIDQELKMLSVANSRYRGSESREDELSKLRTEMAGVSDPTLAHAIKQYEHQVDQAQFDNEP